MKISMTIKEIIRVSRMQAENGKLKSYLNIHIKIGEFYIYNAQI